jgi:hypothetical protein
MTSLVGRDGDLEGLRAALGETRPGRGGFVLMTGEAGMGKTSVLNALARDAADAGAQVLFGSCMSTEEAPPLLPWSQVVRAWLKASAPMLQELTSGCGAIVAGRRLFDQTDGWGDNHPAGAPVVVVTHGPPPADAGERFPRTTFAGSVEEGIATAKDLDFSESGAQVTNTSLIKTADANLSAASFDPPR